MKYLLLAIIPFFSCCKDSSPQISDKTPSLPEGVSLQTSKAGELVITLDKDATVAIRQKNGILLAVSNLDSILQTLQISDGGKTPVGIQYLSDDKAEVTIRRISKPDAIDPFIVDHDGDGIPEFKYDYDETGKMRQYKLLKIEWAKVTNPKQ